MPLFTKANAATIGKRGALARWARARLPPPLPATPPPSADPWPGDRVIKIRHRIEALDRLLAGLLSGSVVTLDLVDGKQVVRVCDPKAIRDLVAALDLLHKQEQQLSGRPLPGSLRPSRTAGPPRPAAPAVVVDLLEPPGPAGQQDTWTAGAAGQQDQQAEGSAGTNGQH